MFFSTPPQSAILLKRYKRFLADVQFADGTITTAHCPNTGTMLGCSSPGSRVLLSHSDNPKRKYPLTLEAVEDNGGWVGVNTSRTNAIVAEAIVQGQISEFTAPQRLHREVPSGKGSRLDLLLEYEGGTKTWIEVKNCSLAEAGRAMFPDAVTTRGAKHLAELTRLHQAGDGACIFYLIQRLDAEIFSPAHHIDPAYSQALIKAVAAGVLPLAYQAEVSEQGISVIRPLPIELH